ncbi:hypothetical protein Q5P01_023581 [Channa striata]|uniref:Uncharacterized protein n=1 Tax=Channa striata TaxID=64152 RepID=A0AA88LQI1_CHASR|nr:hypothetical protein Q5P01_023581 [Channa striata]
MHDDLSEKSEGKEKIQPCALHPKHGHYMPTELILAAEDSRVQLHMGLDFILLTLESLFTLSPKQLQTTKPLVSV